jgi:tetratricopeptide (TPR) repeat protein
MSLPARGYAEVDKPLAERIGRRLRRERLRAGLTQARLAEGRYTKAYVSALENGLVKPSMAALNFFAGRLGIPATTLLTDEDSLWLRLEADVRLASGDWDGAALGYRALLGAAPPGPGQRAEILRGLAESMCRLDRGMEAIAPAAESAAVFTALGRTVDAAAASYWEANGHYQAGNASEARAILSELLRQIREGLRVEPDFKTRVLIASAMVESREDRASQALAFLEEARTEAAELDDRRRATYLFSLAIAYRELGDFEDALRNGRESLSLFRAADARFESASIDNELALVHLGLGQLGRAREYALEAEGQFERLRDRGWLAHVVETRAQIELADGNASEAARLAREALVLARDTANRKAECSALLTLGRADAALGSLATASETLAAAAEIAREGGRVQQLEEILLAWADVLATLGDLRGAYERSREAALLPRTSERGVSSSRALNEVSN